MIQVGRSHSHPYASTNIEALLTGINAQYKNTLEAPNANDYDRYREMTSVELLEAFKSFHATLLNSVVLTVDGSPIPLKISEVYVNEGMTMKRIRPRAKGRADRIFKRSSHITVTVSDK